MRNSERFALEKFLTRIAPGQAFDEVLAGIGAGGINMPKEPTKDKDHLIQRIRDTQKEYEALILASGGSEVGSVPTIVVQVNAGLVELATSDTPANVIVLDADTEGGDEENIFVVDDNEYYVHKFGLDDDKVSQSRVNPEYVENVVLQTRTKAPFSMKL